MQLILSARCSRSLYSSQTTTPHPHTTPPTSQKTSHQDTMQQTQDKHRNTKHPTTPPHQEQDSQEACCLKTQQCTKHTHSHHTPCAPFQHHQPPKEPALRTKPHTPHNTNHANTRTPENTTIMAAPFENPFPDVEFIDIPPLSNPPEPHSGPDMGTKKMVSSLERR